MNVMHPRKQTIILAIIFGIVSLILVLLIIYPLFKEIKRNSEDLISAKRTLISLQTEIENLEQFKEIYKTLKPNLKRMKALFANPKVPINLIKFLEKTGTDSEVLIEISPASFKKTGTDPWSSIGFQISLIGSLPNCLKFLEKLETAPYLIEVQNFFAQWLSEDELRTKKYEGFSEGDVTANLLIKVFTQ